MSYSIEQLYVMWLKGKSLRSLGKLVGTHHGGLHAAFKKAYGVNACNLKSKSLVRSVLEDYETNEEVIKWAIGLATDESTEYFKSKHSLQQLSNYQTLREEYILNQVEAPEDDSDGDVWGFIRLPLYLEILEEVKTAIAYVMIYAAVELDAEDAINGD